MDEEADQPGEKQSKRGPGLEPSRLFPGDPEICAVLGVGRERFRRNLPRLEAQGFPKPDPIFRGRYWPAVREFLDRRAGIGITTVLPRLDPVHEDWSRGRKR